MYCFFAHHRCASSSTNDILRELARVLGWRHITVHTPDMYGDNLPEFCRTQHPDLLTFSNARWDHREGLPTFRRVHLIRDPRDVLVSSYYSHRESHSLEGWRELQPHRQALQSANKEQGLLLEIDLFRILFNGKESRKASSIIALHSKELQLGQTESSSSTSLIEI